MNYFYLKFFSEYSTKKTNTTNKITNSRNFQAINCLTASEEEKDSQRLVNRNKKEALKIGESTYQVKETKHIAAILVSNFSETFVRPEPGMDDLDSRESLYGANSWRLTCPTPFLCLNISTGLA